MEKYIVIKYSELPHDSMCMKYDDDDGTIESCDKVFREILENNKTIECFLVKLFEFEISKTNIIDAIEAVIEDGYEDMIDSVINNLGDDIDYIVKKINSAIALCTDYEFVFSNKAGTRLSVYEESDKGIIYKIKIDFTN